MGTLKAIQANVFEEENHFFEKVSPKWLVTQNALVISYPYFHSVDKSRTHSMIGHI